MKRWITIWLILCAAPFTLCGCGGGGSAQAGGSAGGGGNGGGSISEISRTAAIDAVGRVAISTSRTDRTKFASTVLSFMRKRPEFVRSGITPSQSIWGRFSDGVFYIVYNNRSDLHAGPSISDTADTYSFADPGKAATGRAAEELPAGKRWLVLNYFESTDQMVGFVQTQGGKHNYSVMTKPMSLKACRTLNGADVAVLNTHGDTVPDDSGAPSDYYILTNALYSEHPGDTITSADKRAGYLGIGTDPAEPPDSSGNPVKHWALNTSFASHYWSFNKNSMLYLACCDSMDFEPFRKACFQNKLDLYVGWYKPVAGVTAENVGQFAFDRMLGGNKFDALPYGGRPVIWPDVMAEIVRQGFDHDPTGAILAYEQSNSNGLGVLSPSIQRMEVDELNNKLTIRGYFGTVKGTVTVGGMSVGINSWKPETVECNLPGDKRYVGDVVVTVGDRKSNAVSLTEIHARLIYVQDVLDYHSEIVFDTFIRVDIHRYRDTLSAPPQRTKTITFTASPYSTAKFSHSGVIKNVVLSGSGSLAYNKSRTPFNPSIPGYVFDGTIDTTTSPWTVSAHLWFEGADGIVRPPPPGTPESWSIIQNKALISYATMDPPLNLSSIKFNLDPDSLSVTNPARKDTSSNITHTLKFEGLPANASTVPKNLSEDNAAE